MIRNFKIWLWYLRQSKPQPWYQRMHLDLPLLIGLIVLGVYGLLILYSAGGKLGGTMVLNQGLRLVLSIGILLAVAQIPIRFLRYITPWLYFSGLLLLIAVLAVGTIKMGAQRWLNLGIIQIQPSELMKLAVPMMVAWFLADRLPITHGGVILGALIVIVPFLLIAKQPDLGTALLTAGAGFAVLFLAGLPWIYLLGLGGVIALVAPVAWHFLYDYQRQRILTLFNPEADPLGTGYHIIQSKIAIGSGGIYGKGWLHGSQTQLDFLPEQSTDFIFAVLAEEFGLAGILILLALYLFIIARGLYIAVWAQDAFSRLVAGAITISFAIYVVVNIGMVSGLLPVVGVPLPLVSYGGTSMVTLMGSFGMVMSIHAHRKLLPT